MLVWAYQQKVSRLKNVAEKLKIRYGKNKTISVRVKGRLDPIFQIPLAAYLGQCMQDTRKNEFLFPAYLILWNKINGYIFKTFQGCMDKIRYPGIL